jgi:hypothetical protein
METKRFVRLLCCGAMLFALEGCGGDAAGERVSPDSDLIFICLLCPVPATLVSGVNPTSIALDDTYVYFTNAASLPYELDRAPLAGGTKTKLASNNFNMSSLTRNGTVLYWADFSETSSAGGVWQMSTPGGTATHLSDHPSDAGQSRQAVAVYFSGQSSGGPIQTIPTRHVLFASVLDAALWDYRNFLFSTTEVSLLPPNDPVTHLLYYPYSVVTDSSSRLYFTNDASQGLWSAPLTGGAATQLASNVNRDSLAIAGGNLYFQMGANLVTMSELGGAITTLVPNVDTISQIVEHNGVLYWTSASKGSVSLLSLAPGSSRGVLASSQPSPQAIAVDDTWVYFGTSTALKRIKH